MKSETYGEGGLNPYRSSRKTVRQCVYLEVHFRPGPKPRTGSKAPLWT